MDFKQLDIYTNSEAVTLLTMRLSELGINGFIIHDSADFEEFLENKENNWDYVDDSLMNLKNTPTFITAYLPNDEQGIEMLSAVSGALGELRALDENLYGSLEMKIDNVREEDWANNWKQYYKPFCIGDKIIIKPTWENVTDIGNRKILEIDPASTFGTGQHHTTRLCIEQLENVVKGGERQLDLGCGSGILSIAGLLLGAKSAVMVDVFDNAVRTAGENVEQNGFTKEQYVAYCGNVIDDEALREKIGGGYDIITANIVADVIIGMSPLFGKFLKKGGTLIVSGIITERLSEVLSALAENGLTMLGVHEKEGWNCILLNN